MKNATQKYGYPPYALEKSTQGNKKKQTPHQNLLNKIRQSQHFTPEQKQFLNNQEELVARVSASTNSNKTNNRNYVLLPGCARGDMNVYKYTKFLEERNTLTTIVSIKPNEIEHIPEILEHLYCPINKQYDPSFLFVPECMATKI